MTAPSYLFRLPVQMLGDLVSPRALERILQDAAQARGRAPGDLDSVTLEDILKREVFKRLQLSVPAPLAKKRVSEVLDELMKTTQERAALDQAGTSLLTLEEQARKFTLYFDWPETQRLRGVLGVARQEEREGRDVSALVLEGQGLVAQMERRLQEGLVAQAQDLAELRATFMRVQGMGSREVRRLETLITQIEEAQEQATLLPGEVERARNITFTLRKLLESSVVQQVSSDATAAPDPAAQARVQALEQEHNAQQLSTTEREFAPLLLARPDLNARQAQLRAAAQSGKLTEQSLTEWREQLGSARAQALEEQRAEFASLEQSLTQLSAGAEARVALDAARHTLESGHLATDELRELQGTLSALRSGVNSAAQLAAQRELLEIERSARNVPGASRDLSSLIQQAQTDLSQGQAIDLSALWNVLERHMGAAAQEREDFDARADHVIHEYDAVRSLAGETTQRLGRLAETLRAQRRLGPMSAQARERYEQTLLDAEALLQEAHAEYRAAQEVTATFGQDALSGLLDVFDVGDGATSGVLGGASLHSTQSAALTTDSLLAGLGLGSMAAPTLTSTPPTTANPETAFQFNFDALSAAVTPQTPEAVPQPLPESAALPETQEIPEAQEITEAWDIKGLIILNGPPIPESSALVGLIAQADQLHVKHLNLSSDTHQWEAQRNTSGYWNVTRKPL